MSKMFKSALIFNQNIGIWDVSQVTNMQEMFSQADEFQQNLNAWNISRVRNKEFMFDTLNMRNSIPDWYDN